MLCANKPQTLHLVFTFISYDQQIKTILFIIMLLLLSSYNMDDNHYSSDEEDNGEEVAAFQSSHAGVL
jgi:hypothetical protein